MKCVFCQNLFSKHLQLGEIISLNQGIENSCCPTCFLEINRLDMTQGYYCQYCKKKLINQKRSCCKDCGEWEKNLIQFDLKHSYLYEHNEKMKEYFNQFKFLGDIKMKDAFSLDLHLKLKSFQEKKFIIVPIPISKRRMLDRGFNQVESFLESSNISYERLLHKNEQTKKQSELNRRERLATEQPFFVRKKSRKKIYQKQILLVDDVYTTGRTILHAYECLKQYKPSKICSFSLTR